MKSRERLIDIINEHFDHEDNPQNALYTVLEILGQDFDYDQIMETDDYKAREMRVNALASGSQDLLNDVAYVVISHLLYSHNSKGEDEAV